MDLDTSEALAEANQSSSERSETVTVSVESFLEREVDVTTETGQEILVPYVPVHLNFQLKQLSRDLTPEERFAKLTQTLLTVRSCLTFLDSPPILFSVAVHLVFLWLFWFSTKQDASAKDEDDLSSERDQKLEEKQTELPEEKASVSWVEIEQNLQ